MLPVPVSFPVPPVPLDAMVRNPLVMPFMPPPAALPIVMPPVGRDLSIKGGNVLIIYPARAVFPRAIPVTVPRTPPPAVAEEDVHIYIRDGVDICPRQHDQFRRFDKYDGRRQGNADTDTYLAPR
jgi:hypothetical protein